MFNFAEATQNAIAAGAALEVADAKTLLETVGALLLDPARRLRMHDAALAFHAEHRGAADRLWAWLAPRLPKELGRAASTLTH
jgi:3-deoxy-D-manno-octulosonic-acid transferase